MTSENAAQQVAAAPVLQSAAPPPRPPQGMLVDAGVPNVPEDASRSKQVDHGATQTVRVPKTGILAVSVKPFAEVFVDGTRIGTTPIPDYKLSAGPHQVRLVAGDKHEELTVTIEPGKQKVIKRQW